MSRAFAVEALRALLDDLPLHPTAEQWQALADACELTRGYALLRAGVVYSVPCPAVGPVGRPCALTLGHRGRHVDARGKRFSA